MVPYFKKIKSYLSISTENKLYDYVLIQQEITDQQNRIKFDWEKFIQMQSLNWQQYVKLDWKKCQQY